MSDQVDRGDIRPIVSQPWKTTMSLMVLAVPALRIVFGKHALGRLHTRVLVEPKAIAFELLSRLGTNRDPTFVWHLLNLLLRACLGIAFWVAQATGLCRPATRRTERAGHPQPMKTAKCSW